jgi:D-3-phosphoglycerate dehydrogenase
MKRKVLFIDTAHPILKEELINLGFQCDYFPEYKTADYHKIIKDYYGIIIRSKINIDRRLIDNASSLRFIGRVGSGMESIDRDYAESKGIQCLNSPEGNRDAVGEHVTGMLLDLMNKISKSNAEIRSGVWLREENRGIEIKGKTVGIIGYGNMGSSFACKLRGFEAEVIAYDKYKTGFSNENVQEASMKKIFDETDILSLHVPLTDETTYLVDNKYINSFRKNIFLLNSSRGKVVSTDDLVECLKTGKVCGAALDVIEYEDTSFEKLNREMLPESYKFLLSSDKVILTPHIAGWTYESRLKLATVLIEKIKSII